MMIPVKISQIGQEPYYGAPRIISVRRVLQNDSAVVLSLETADRSDIFALELDGTAPVTFADFSTNALLGFASFPKSGPPFAAMIGGTKLKAGAETLNMPEAIYQGPIESITSQWEGAADNTFVISTALPAGETLRGAWMSVSLGDGAAMEAFEIDHVAPGGRGSTIYLKDDPGLRTSGNSTTEVFFPRRQFSGANKFTIYTRAVSK